MSDREHWKEIYKAWNDVSVCARLCEAMIIDKMDRYFDGNAEKPTQMDLDLAHHWYEEELRLRIELDHLIVKHVGDCAPLFCRHTIDPLPHAHP